MRGMRKRYRVSLLAVLVAAFVVPVGFALSLESSAPSIRRQPVSVGSVGAVAATTSAAVTSSVLVTGASVDATSAAVHPVPDAAKLLIVGTTLFGLAAAVRKAI